MGPAHGKSYTAMAHLKQAGSGSPIPAVSQIDSKIGKGIPIMASEKVLIVEDEENERTGLAELISAWGYRTEVARDGVEGLEKVVEWDPGIVVTDLRMPRMDGMELLEKIARQPQQVGGRSAHRAGQRRRRCSRHEARGIRLSSRSRSIPPACATSCRMPPASAARSASWKSPSGNCATRASWAR